MLFLSENFDGQQLDGRLQWFNAPSRWCIDRDASALVVEPDAQTDFWRKTHYGFEADNGHLLFATVEGDFVMTAKIGFYPVNQYDQAGLMVRLDENCWLKTSVEYELLEPAKLGAVVTNAGYSDWSVQDFDRTRREVWLRVARKGGDCMVDFSLEGVHWTPLRVAHLHGTNCVAQCGVYACSPKGAGFRAEFQRFQIEQPEDSI